MSYYRSYFKKNNTLVSNSLVNTAKNPTTDLYYGNGFSKFIFQIDLVDLQNKITNGDLVLNSDTKHYLRMTNTIFGSESFVGQENSTGGLRATSFDLTILPINEFWDEGVGFDYEESNDLSLNDNKTFDSRPSNWYNRTTLETWENPGVFETLSNDSLIQTVHFDNGNENINIDITDYVNSILVSGLTNNGLVLSFIPEYFSITDKKESVSFFTKYTQTFYEPYVETIFNDVINDDRENFITGINQNLYLYVTKNGNFIDLDVLPLVTILDGNGLPVNSSLSGMTSEKVRKGVYRIDFGLTGNVCVKKFYYDKWSNLIINGVSLNDVKQKFIPKPYDEMFETTTSTNGNEYVLKYDGIKLNEKIKRGETRKISVVLKSFKQTKNVLSEELYYRVFIKEGNLQVSIFDWTKIDKTVENSFLLDTGFLIPREYYIEIKSKNGYDEIFFKNEIKFEIVSEK